MRLIEISETVAVNIDSIDAVQENADTTSRVNVGGNIYTSIIPYKTLLLILKQAQSSEQNGVSGNAIEQTVKKIDGVLSTMGSFAG